MTVIHGRYCVIEMFTGDQWNPVLCGTDMDFQYNPEFITKTGPNSAARQYALRIYDWTMSVTGLTRVENETALSFFYMLQEAVRGSEQQIRARYMDEDDNQKQISGTAFIGQSSITGPATDFSNCVINFRGTGDFTIDDVTPPVVPASEIFSDWWQTVNGNAFINGASSGQTDGTNYTLGTSDEILEVDVDGMEFEIVTGTPGNREAQPDLSNNRINFLNTFDGMQRVFVLFKRTA